MEIVISGVVCLLIGFFVGFMTKALDTTEQPRDSRGRFIKRK